MQRNRIVTTASWSPKHLQSSRIVIGSHATRSCVSPTKTAIEWYWFVCCWLRTWTSPCQSAKNQRFISNWFLIYFFSEFIRNLSIFFCTNLIVKNRLSSFNLRSISSSSSSVLALGSPFSSSSWLSNSLSPFFGNNCCFKNAWSSGWV